ncbi:MAG: EAL domain-containing protein [Cyanobacteria bacterium J06639_14]
MLYWEVSRHHSSDAKAASSYFKREFQLCYQPVVALETKGLHSFETFASWQQERAHLYSPNVLALVEHSNLDTYFYQWMFYEACRQLHVWQAYCLANVPLSLSINLSAKQLDYPHLARSIKQMMKEIGVDPTHLQLEIPAKWIRQNGATAKSVIMQLKRTGVAICVDDVDILSAAYDCLQTLPIDIFKTSAACTHQLSDDIGLANCFQEIIATANQQNIKLIPQGIERPEQLTALMALGCIYGQGDLFLQPVIAREATTLISGQVENQPQELMTYLVAMNVLSEFAQQFLGKALVSRYWKETKPTEPWLALLEPYSDRSELLSSTQETVLDVKKQQDLRYWTRRFIQRCDHIIREFSQLLTQAKLTSSEAQLLRKLWLIAH